MPLTFKANRLWIVVLIAVCVTTLHVGFPLG